MSEIRNSPRRPLEVVLYHEDRQLARCLIRRGRYVIGHEKKNEIVLDEPSISAKHARLDVVSDDEIYIEDLESANGTFVEGEPIRELTQIGHGSAVQLGATTLCFQRSGLPAEVFPQLSAGFLRLQRYELGEVVVQGRTSTIYAARDTALDRDLALKVMLPSSQRKAPAVLRFIREAQIGSQLQHSGVLPVYDLGLDERNQLYFTTRFVQGESLADVLQRMGSDDERTLAQYSLGGLLTIWHKVCDTVAYAHSRGLVHTCLTPHSITLGAFGEVFVTNWTLSRQQSGELENGARIQMTESTDQAPLSPFSSPEQAAGALDEIDVRTDVHALGGILYSIITLHFPLVGESEDELLEAALNSNVTPIASIVKEGACPHWPGGKIPEAAANIALKALSRAREDRYETVSELKGEITAWQEGSTGGVKLGALWKRITALRESV